jgi:hypothetical protein
MALLRIYPVTDLIKAFPGNGSINIRVSDRATQSGDFISNTEYFPWGLCKGFIRDVNS